MRILVRLTAKLARRVVALGVVLVLVVAVLGGAAALGSTLFEGPPRNADELAERAAEAVRNDAGAPRQTAAESRFGRRLADLCRRHQQERADLGEPVPTSEIPAWFRRSKPVLGRNLAEIAALKAPRSYRRIRDEGVALGERSLTLWGRVAQLARAGDRDGVGALIGAVEELEAEAGARFAAMGAPVCTTR